MSDSARISPTAHYTGYVWAKNGLSDPALATLEGRVLFETMRPWNAVNAIFGGETLETYLLARHSAIDALLERAIEQDGISQVIEVACGFSPRGLRFSRRFADRITYVEADLPEMAARKRAALERVGSLGEQHRVVAVDALRDDGDQSLAALAGQLDSGRGTAIITEGLIGYLDGDTVAALWRRFATVLGGFPTGRYFSDLHIGGVQTAQVRAFRLLLSAFVRGRVHLHFEQPEEGERALVDAGFATAHVVPARSVSPGVARDKLAHVLDAAIA
jgi:O-methyltransferase involved in polyketide biosynthesis